jgi:hypothetical protein
MSMRIRIIIVLLLMASSATPVAQSRLKTVAGENPRSDQPARSGPARPPKDDADLRRWLENMVWHHRFTNEEISAATGLDADLVAAVLNKFAITAESRPVRSADAPLLVLPYPGGRHPRIGFLDGAVDPQRETKVSVFAPWDRDSYVVVDVPEAIWSNLGLTYLAHTHVPTIWTESRIELPKLEWRSDDQGALVIDRTLPNGISFAARVRASADAVRMELWLTNGTTERLSDLRVQNCVMLKGAAGFTAQTNDNKLFRAPYAAAHDERGRRWVISGWEPCHRAWGNPPCPCLHADPKFPDLDPGQTGRLLGWLSFYEGDDIDAELARIDASGWRDGAR